MVNPANIPTTQKELFQKSDSIDSRKIARVNSGSCNEPSDFGRQGIGANQKSIGSGYYPVKEQSEIIPLFSWNLHSGRILKKEWALEQKVYKMAERRDCFSPPIRKRSFELFDFERGKSICKSQRD